MKLLILALLLLILPIASADNVTIEIFQNSNDEFFIQYNGELHACVDDECTFNVSANVTQQDYDVALSTKDIKKIAQYVALEVNMPTGQSWDLNRTYFDTTTGVTREQLYDRLAAYIDNTVVPEVDKYNAETSARMAAEAKVVELENKGINYDNMKETKDETISVLKDENEWLKYLCFILGLGMLAVMCFNSGAFKRLLELKRGKR